MPPTLQNGLSVILIICGVVIVYGTVLEFRAEDAISITMGQTNQALSNAAREDGKHQQTIALENVSTGPSPAVPKVDPVRANPEYRRLVAIQTRRDVIASYGAFLRRMALTPDQNRMIVQSLVERLIAKNENDQVTQSSANAALSNLVSAETLAQYEETQPQRTEIERFGKQLRFTADELNDEQIERLVYALKQFPEFTGGPTQIIPEPVIKLAGKILNPIQEERFVQFNEQRSSLRLMGEIALAKAKK